MTPAVPLRRALAWISVAATSLVAVAFVIPLTVLVGHAVRDRALEEAFRTATGVGAVLAVDRSPEAVAAFLDQEPPRTAGRIAVHLPAAGRGGASARIERVVGPTAAPPGDVVLALRTGVATTVPIADGVAVLQPVALGAGLVAVVEVDVPDATLDRGVPRARAMLIGLAVVLVLASVLLADRLAARVVRAAGRLRTASGRLGSGDLDVRVTPEGPDELQQAAVAFNVMADRVGDLLAAERELVADLSHRLRTPLTGLMQTGASLGPGVAGDQVRAFTARLAHEVDAVITEARRRSEPAVAGAGSVRAQCDAGAVLRERLDFWGALAEDQGRPWTLEVPADPVLVPVSAVDLGTALDALLGNVFLHTPQGCAFVVTLRDEGSRAGIVVGDAGPGIPDPDAAMRRGSSGQGSSGLGLDIAARVARSGSGRFLIGRSALGGAEVTVELGTRPAPAPAAPAARPRRRWR